MRGTFSAPHCTLRTDGRFLTLSGVIGVLGKGVPPRAPLVVPVVAGGPLFRLF